MKSTVSAHRPPRRPKSWGDMNTEELAAATAEFDKEDLAPPKPLRGEKLRRYRHAMRKRGRPRIGKGSQAITVTLEKELLSRTDRTAKRRGITRSQLIALALTAEVQPSNHK